MPKSASSERRLVLYLALAAVVIPLQAAGPWAILWTAPSIIVASLIIAWGAESAQFFIAQGFALAILAWMQTLPEFAVEGILAWKQQTALLMANLTGAVRLLTGLVWPMIFLTAAIVHKRHNGRFLRAIKLDPHQSVEVVALAAPLLYAIFIWWKHSVHLFDGVVLISMYAGYLLLLIQLPPQSHEDADGLESVPRRIVTAPRLWRNFAIASCFLAGGVLIYFIAEPFLGSLVALAGAFGIPAFVIIQWLAPVISEFPEMMSTFYFARQQEKAPVALMNVASSNLSQWTLLFGLLPIVFSLTRGSVSSIELSEQQSTELLLTIAQSLVALVFLANMSFAWIEAAAMLVLFIAQFVVAHAQVWITGAFVLFLMIELLVALFRRRMPLAISAFVQTWKQHVRPR